VRLAAVVGWTVRHHPKRVLEESDMDALTEASGRAVLACRRGQVSSSTGGNERLAALEKSCGGKPPLTAGRREPVPFPGTAGGVHGMAGIWHGEGVEQA
jgi:hypothetical protein